MAATNFQSLIRVALFSFLCAFDINRRIQIAPRLPNDVRGNALGFCNGTLSHGVAVLFRPRATKLNLTTSAGFNKTKSALNKPSKRGFTSLAIPGHDPPIDLTIFVDIAVNPGPSPTLVSSFNSTASSVWPLNLHTGSSRFTNLTLPRISYNRRFLMGLRPCSVKPSLSTLKSLKSFGILKFRGKRAGRRKIRTLISDRSTSVSPASLRSNVNRCNLITIPLQPQSNDCAQKRQQVLSNFALINSRSIRNRTLLLNDYVSEHNIDILAITETWLHGDNFDSYFCRDICPEGFSFSHVPRSSSEGGGVGLLVRRQFKVTKIPFADFRSFEAIQVLLKSTGNLNLRLVNIYRPPPSPANGLSIPLFLEEFRTFLEQCILTPEPLMLVGDFNFHIDRQTDCDAKRFVSILDSFDLVQHVACPTHRDGHTLDLVITRASEKELVSNCCVGQRISDHFAVHCNLALVKPSLERKVISYRKTRSIDFDKFRQDLANSSLLSDSSDHADLDALVGAFNDTLSHLVDSHAPLKTRTITIRSHSPWYTDEIATEKRKRRSLERRWRSSRLSSDYENYVTQCNVENNMLRAAKVSYYGSIIEGSKHDQRVLFQTVEKLLHTKPKPHYPTSCSYADLANKFADFFTEKIARIQNSLYSPTSTPGQLLDVSPPPDCVLSCFETVTEDHVASLITSSAIKCCPLDPAPAVIFKECVSVILPVITKIVNLSINSCVVPDCFKVAMLNPLLKKMGLDFQIFANFRPISNLMFLSKLSERVVAVQLINYVMTNDLGELFQSAYKQLHSTETALLRVHNDILLALDNHQSVILLLLDLSAAFDTVDHTILLNRLSTRFGILGAALSWFSSYLSNRYQFVNIRGQWSSNRPLECGVPQGSVLGPILYLLYTAPLGDIVRKYNMGFHFYADDTQLYLSFDSKSGAAEASAVAQIEACAGEIDNWMSANRLKLNSDKSELLIINSKYRPRPLVNSISFGGSIVQASPSARNLGVVFDNESSLDKHISAICKSAFFHLRRIAKIRSYLTEEATIALVHAFITCRLDNGNALLFGLPKYQIQRLQSILNCAARLVKRHSKFDRASPLLFELHWLPVEQRITFKILLFVFKSLNGLAPFYLSDLISTYVPSRSLRSASLSLLHVPRSNQKTYGDRAFAVAAPRLWNALPIQMRQPGTTLDTFKRSLKTLLFGQAFYRFL